MIVSEAQLENALDRLQDGEDIQSISPEILEAYLHANGKPYMSTADRTVLEFAVRLMIKCAEDTNPALEWNLEELLDINEALYESLEKEHKDNYQSFIDSLFEKYANEELLAFLEDLLLEDVELSSRSLILVSGTSIVDVLEHSSDPS